MGALTLKSFPFELRGWDIEKLESLDPTDGFGSNTKVYVHRNQIIQIEPNHDFQSVNSWLTDRGRHFFDGVFNTGDGIDKKTVPWFSFVNLINRAIYIFDQCAKQNSKNYFFTVVFNHLNIEMLSILLLVAQNYSFIKIRKTESANLNISLESSFQLSTLAKP